MSNKRRITKNVTVLFSSQIINYILLFFATIYMARYLGVENFGIISLSLAITGIFSVFTDLGLSNLTVREVARDKSLANKYLVNITFLKVFLAFLNFGIIILIVNLIGYSNQVNTVIYLMTISSILVSFYGFFNSIFQAYEKMEYQSFASIINGLLMFLGVILLIKFNLDIIYFAFIYILINAICLIYSIIICLWKFFIPKIEIDWSFMKPLIIKAIPLSAALFFSIIGFRIDSVLISIIKGNIAVGYYTAPYKFIEALTFLPSGFTIAIFPVMSKYYVSSLKSLEKAYKQSFKYLSILGLPIAVGTTLLANNLIISFYGSAYIPSIFALQILIWQVPLVFLTYFFGTLLVSIDKQKLLLKILFITMSFNIALNLVLIPYFSYYAASLITVLTELVAFIIIFYYLSKFICVIKIQTYFIKPIIASTIMGLFIYYSNQGLIIEIILSTIVYFTALILLKTFTKEDVNIIREIIRGKVV
jgi:O-antigen/teichoic acid export membrane protein